MDVKKLTVVDINAGLGGRASAYLKSGFDVIAAFGNDLKDMYYLEQLAPNVPCAYLDLRKDGIGNIPKADILSVNYSVYKRNTYKDGYDFFAVWKAISELIVRDMPMALVLQIPTVFLKYNDLKILSSEVMRRYTVFYRTFKESEYSEFPISGTQTYVIGLRTDIVEESFTFQQPRIFSKKVFPSKPEAIDKRYRNLPKNLIIEEPLRSDCFYTINHERKLVETNRISLFALRPTFYCDAIGLRRITHAEIAAMKGYDGSIFKECSNFSAMYAKLALEPNLFIFESICESLKTFLINCKSDYGNNISYDKVTDVSNKQKKVKEEINEFLISGIEIENIHIDKLKGLNHLDIPISKRLVAIMGVNGSGKSTVLHALACMFAPFKNGEDYRFSFFFTPNPDASWNGSELSIRYLDTNVQKIVERKYQKKADRWSPYYSRRPKRDIYYLGIDSCSPVIEKESATTFINYTTKSEDDKNSKKIIKIASQILGKQYSELTVNSTKSKKMMGVCTEDNVRYTALSMGAGEQRVIKILQIVLQAEPYSLILIDEIDLLLHAKALKRMIVELSEIAENKKLQIIFTTHSLVMREVSNYIDIRYLYPTKAKTLVLNTITPDIVYDLTEHFERPILLFVEDDLTEAIVKSTVDSLRLSRFTNIKRIGSAQNAFTLAAAYALCGESSEHTRIILDGDVYRTDDEKLKYLKRVLTGTEGKHDENLKCALEFLTELSLPEGMKPEEFIHSMILEVDPVHDATNEIAFCANEIKTVKDSHDWIDEIVNRMNQERNITLHQIVSYISNHTMWESYIINIRLWLLQQREELGIEAND